MNVGVGLVMARAFVNNTMACLVSTNRSVCLGIASTEFAAAISARACVTRVPKRAKGRGMMASAVRLFPAEIPITSAILVNAEALERAISRKRRKPMGRPAHRRGNALRAIVSTACVVIRRARDCATPVLLRKRVKERMERAVPSLPSRIPTMNVGLEEGAEETALVVITMGRCVRRDRNVFRIIALTAFVVETFVRALVMPVAQ